MIYVGIDVHQKTTTFCALDDEGRMVKHGKVATGESRWMEVVSLWPHDQVDIAVETGNMS